VIFYQIIDDGFRFHPIYREFEFHSTKLSWKDAESQCGERHGSLVMVVDATVQGHLHSLFLYREEVDHMDYWIGLHKADSKQWRWISGRNVFAVQNDRVNITVDNPALRENKCVDRPQSY
jgi:hypothetical protein